MGTIVMHDGKRKLVRCGCTHKWPEEFDFDAVFTIGPARCEKCEYFPWVDLKRGWSKRIKEV